MVPPAQPVSDRIVLYSGNLIKAKKAVNSSTSADEQLLESISDALEDCTVTKAEDGTAEFRPSGTQEANGSGHVDAAEVLDTTVKIYYLSSSPQPFPPAYVSESINRLSRHLGLTVFDKVLVSFPNWKFDDAEVELKDVCTRSQCKGILDVWMEVGTLKKSGVARSIGVSEFSICALSKLIDCVEIPPDINQLNLADCCVMPRNMIAFAKEKDIELLTHKDPQDMLTEAAFTALLNKHGIDAEGLKPRWAIRYSSIVRDRGVAANKGFIIMASR